MSSELKESEKLNNLSLWQKALRAADKYVRDKWQHLPLVERNIVFSAVADGFYIGYKEKERENGNSEKSEQ